MRLIRPDHERLNQIVLTYLFDVLAYSEKRTVIEPPRPSLYEENLPDEPRPGIFKYKGFTIVVTIENEKWHISMSHERDRLPKWHEIKAIRYACAPDDAYMAQILPPKSEYVNIAAFCMHLHEVGGH